MQQSRALVRLVRRREPVRASDLVDELGCPRHAVAARLRRAAAAGAGVRAHRKGTAVWWTTARDDAPTPPPTLLEALSDERWHTTAELAELTGLTVSTVRRRVLELEEQGTVERTRRRRQAETRHYWTTLWGLRDPGCPACRGVGCSICDHDDGEAAHG